MTRKLARPYRAHLKAASELVTTYEATRAGFVSLALEKNRRELVFRFLITRGDALGGAMRNVGGILAQRKLTRAILSSLTIAGIPYQWQHSKTRQWATMTQDDAEIEYALRALSWEKGSKSRILIYSFTVPQVANNVDLSLLNPRAARIQPSAA